MGFFFLLGIVKIRMYFRRCPQRKEKNLPEIYLYTQSNFSVNELNFTSKTVLQSYYLTPTVFKIYSDLISKIQINKLKMSEMVTLISSKTN